LKSTEHFLQILLSLPALRNQGATIAVTVEELADVLYCTPRNVKLILRKLVDENFVVWKAGVGRGNPSQLTVLHNLEDVANDYFQDMLDKGKIREAIDLVNRAELPVTIRTKLQSRLENRFGLQVEQTATARLDVLRIPRYRKMARMDPAFVFTAAEAFFLEQICNTLVTYDRRKRRFQPSLAHTWESDEEATRWTFYLRKGVRFHHGRTMTAKDVQFTLQRLRDLRSPSRWQYADIERIEVVNDWTIVFRLKRTNRFFLHFFSCVNMSVLPYDVPFNEQAIVGTGPFRVLECNDRVFVLEAFDDYFRERAMLDRVELWQMTGVYTAIRNYELPYVDTDGDGEEGSNLEYQEFGCRYLIFNFRKEGIHHHPAFRAAMKRLYDPLVLVRDLGGNRKSPANSFLPEKSAHCIFKERRLDEVPALLQACGYAGETLKLYYNFSDYGEEEAKWLKRRCDAVGLRLSIHPFEYNDRSGSGVGVLDADLMFQGEVLEEDLEWGMLRLFMDEAAFAHQMLTAEQRKLLQDCLADFVALTTEEERSMSIDQAERMLRDHDWLLFGYHASKSANFHPSLRGLSIDSFGWVDFSKLWIRP